MIKFTAVTLDGFSFPEYIKILSTKNYKGELMGFYFYDFSGLIDY